MEFEKDVLSKEYEIRSKFFSDIWSKFESDIWSIFESDIWSKFESDICSKFDVNSSLPPCSRKWGLGDFEDFVAARPTQLFSLARPVSDNENRNDDDDCHHHQNNIIDFWSYATDITGLVLCRNIKKIGTGQI